MKRALEMIPLLCLTLVLGSCGGGELDSYGCRSDADCKHGRICVDAQCQDASSACREDGDCPSGQHCYASACSVCDADSDEEFGSQCAGRDCDDSNPAVNSGARELCGDGLDNDCDGATDPAGLCDENCRGVTCPDGWACDPQTGECVPICTPSCVNVECGPDGCGDVCGICEPGLTCSREGRCVLACEDRCQLGSQACVGAELTTCRDTDGDGCVEWDTPQACPPGESCSDGRCTDCRPQCRDRQCGPDGCGGSCGTCPEPMACDAATGKCVDECRDECFFWGESFCSSEWEFMECGDWDGDPCMEYSPPIGCPEGFCNWETGRCGEDCWDECWWGEQFCISDWERVECGQWDEDQCLEFSPPMPCEQGWCDWETNQCGGDCWNECNWWGESYCWDEYGWVECGDWNGDGCLEFSERLPCPQETRCDFNTGQCDFSCLDECWWGESYCIDEQAFIECGEWDGDACLEFGPPMQCQAGEPCEDGRCGGCWDECFWGERFCWDEFGFVECGDWDADSCTEFGPRQPCPEGSPCDWNTGTCGAACQDDCWWGQVICPGQHRYQACGEYDGDPCADWGPVERCPQGTICSEDMGGCVPEECWDECMPGERFCWDEWSWVECGQYDQDPCMEFGPPFPCPADAPCDWATGFCNDCRPMTCWDLGHECGWWNDGCGQQLFCGNCQANEICNWQGQCQSDGGRDGAGQPCGPWQPCLANWSAAWICAEAPGTTEGVCSYPCDSDADCAVDFPNGCCRELVPGYGICLPDQQQCQFEGAGYQEPCTWGGNQTCLPDMFCIEGYLGNDSACLFTCETAMGICPQGGNCLPMDDGTSTGLCLPTGDGQFADTCDMLDGCVAGLLCTPLDEEHPGFCNTMCSGFLPCPNGFDCVLDDGEGGTWCAELCSNQSDCDRLGAWECVYAWGPGQGVCLPLQ